MSLPYVTVQLGGKERHLRYTMQAMAEVEERLGLVNIFQDIPTVTLNARNLRTLVWAALLHESPEITEPEVGRWIDGENFTEVSEAFGEALKRFFPKPNGKEPSGDRPLPSGGTRSARSRMARSLSLPPSSGEPASRS
mgnify:CR=1 FL=1